MTIHSISESKFHRGDLSASALGNNAANGVEITRIPSVANRPMMSGAPSGSSSPLHLPLDQSAAISLNEIQQKEYEMREMRRQMRIQQEAEQLMSVPPPPRQSTTNLFRGLSDMPPPGFGGNIQNRAVGSNRLPPSMRLRESATTPTFTDQLQAAGSNQYGGMWYGHYAQASKEP